MPTSARIDGFRQRGGRDRRSGFTLVEMALALAVIGLLAALGLPFMRPPGGVTALRVKTIEVVALLRSERNTALRARATTTVLVDPDNRVVQSAISAARIVLPTSMALRSDLRRLRFFADGRSSGGEIAIVAGKAMSVVRINSLTSAIDIAGP